MPNRATIFPRLVTSLSVLAVGAAFVACQFHPYDRDYGWPYTWLRGHGWHPLEFAITATTGFILIASTYAASRLFVSAPRERSRIRLSTFFVWTMAAAILLSICNFSDTPPEWLEPYTEHEFTGLQMLVVVPLLFGFGCVVCLAWSLTERAIDRILSRNAASA